MTRWGSLLTMVLLSLSGIVLAQQQQMPECAGICLQSSLEAQTACAPDNLPCICTNVPLNNAIQACVGKSCTVKQALVALNVTSTMCDRPIRDRTHITNVLIGTTGGFALVAVILRTSNALWLGSFQADDACALAAGLFMIIDNAVTFPTGPAGFGKDVWTVPFENITYILKLIFLMQNFYWPVSTLTKLSFLFFYLRIFPAQNVRRYVYATMALTAAYYLTFQFGNLFYCRPVSLVWNGWDGEHAGSCVDINKFMISATAVNIFIDVVIIILPIPHLVSLNLSWRKKVGLIAMFLVGGVTLVVSVLRIQSILNYAKSQNGTYDNVPAGFWSLVEVNIGVFCVCMPAIRRILASALPRLFASTNASRGRPTYVPSTNQHRRKKTPTFGGSLLNDTAITKTVTTHVQRDGDWREDDDQINLVQVRGGRGMLKGIEEERGRGGRGGSRSRSTGRGEV
ncbi:hypothetical protein BDV95DRAFT_613177 [Massariosphaeria phaeospora]|uniref:CFEM domain-containing protein n=1 Tax=Massariosphaeria phaeospora TaxID=100035 RepID=A0A7C8I0Q1_9PLEO|nr:hypothetical protein BDV95DRAFT_613177 [Massariosphaeria phaeospora]